MVTETDRSNGNVYYTTNSDGSTPNLTWGQGVTGTAGGSGFGANFKYILDNCGNASYIIFTGQEYLSAFVDINPAHGQYTFFTAPETSWLRLRLITGIRRMRVRPIRLPSATSSLLAHTLT